MTARTRISDRTLLAHCLARLLEIPHEHQQAMHQDHVISLIERDHWPIPVAEGGSGHFSNVWARPIGEHREKTRKVDVPGIAKRKRIARAAAEHKIALEIKAGTNPSRFMVLLEREIVKRRAKRRIAGRGFAKDHRPLRSKNNLRRRQS